MIDWLARDRLLATCTAFDVGPDAMRNHPEARRRSWIGGALAALVLALPAATLLPDIVLAETAADVQPAAAAAKDIRVPRKRKGSSLEDHVKALSKALDLDASQESELRKLLMDQREQIKKVWDDTTVPPPYRVSTTQAISDKTADRIRALLNDEQKKKYNPPKTQPPPSDVSGRSVEDWMDAMKPK